MPEHRSPESHLLSLLVHVRDNQSTEPGGTRQTIVRKAMVLFTQLGYGGASMRAIAAEVGVQAGSMYGHFPQGKQQILFEGLRDILQEFLAHLSATLTPDMSHREQFETLVRRHVSWQMDNGSRGLAWQAAFGGLGAREALSESEQESFRAARLLYYGYVESLIAALGNPDDAHALSRAVLTLCDNANRVRPHPEATPEEVADQVLVLARRIVRLEESELPLTV